jgi:predicted SnoaL-like aldol condensation-catalyzing enzyme
MDAEQTRKFALRLMKEVWETYDHTKVLDFYRLKDGKISEFWTLASIDYDYFDKT